MRTQAERKHVGADGECRRMVYVSLGGREKAAHNLEWISFLAFLRLKKNRFQADFFCVMK